MPDVLSFLLGLIFDPRGVARRSFSKSPPPFELSCLLLFVVTFFVPVILQIYRYDLDVLAIPTTLAFLVYVIISITVFVILEGILLMVIGIMIPLRVLVALKLYIMMQIALGAWILFAYDYSKNGAILLIISLITGDIDSGDSTVVLIPYIYAYFTLAAFLLLSKAIAVAADTARLTGYLLAFFSLVPLYASLVCGIHIADLFRPGLIESFQMLFRL